MHDENGADGTGGVHFDFILPGRGVERFGCKVAGRDYDGIEGGCSDVRCELLACILPSDVDGGDLFDILGCFWGFVRATCRKDGVIRGVLLSQFCP